jgi:drug/metabolite transporter (DMT)-like permease
VLPGVALVVGGVPASMRLGFLVGAFSASLVAVFSTLNKRYTHAAEPLAVTFLELGGGAILMLVLSALWPHTGPVLPLPDTRDAILLGILAVGCTLLPFALSLAALRELSAFGAVLALNLEPVYSIVLAIPLLGEQRELGLSFYAGVAIILGAVVAHPLLMRPTRKAQAETLAVAESHRAAE